MLVDEIQHWGEASFDAPASAAALQACEHRLGHELPLPLRRLLAETNGIEGEYGLGLLWTTQRIADDNARFRDDEALRGLYLPFTGLVFFADAGNGDQFAVSLHGDHEVYVWNHVDDSRARVAPTIMRHLEHWMAGRLTV